MNAREAATTVFSLSLLTFLSRSFTHKLSLFLSLLSSLSQGALAQFSSLSGVAIDATGRFAIVADTRNNRVRRVELTRACSIGY